MDVSDYGVAGAGRGCPRRGRRRAAVEHVERGWSRLESVLNERGKQARQNLDNQARGLLDRCARRAAATVEGAKKQCHIPLDKLTADDQVWRKRKRQYLRDLEQQEVQLEGRLPRSVGSRG